MRCWTREDEEAKAKKRFGLFRRRRKKASTDDSIWEFRRKCLLQSLTPAPSSVPVLRCWASTPEEELKSRGRGLLFWRQRKSPTVQPSWTQRGQCVLGEFGMNSEVSVICACLVALLVAVFVKIRRKAKLVSKTNDSKHAHVKLEKAKQHHGLSSDGVEKSSGHNRDLDPKVAKQTRAVASVDSRSPESTPVSPKRARKDSDDAVVREDLIAAAWKKKKPKGFIPPIPQVDVPAVVAAERKESPCSLHSVERLNQSIEKAADIGASDSASDLAENVDVDLLYTGRRASTRSKDVAMRRKSMSPLPRKESLPRARRRNSFHASGDKSSGNPDPLPASPPLRTLSRHSSTKSDLIDSCETKSSGSLGDMSFEQARIRRSNSIGNMSRTSCDDSTLGGESTMSERREFLTIFYASQSGTSAYFANQLQREGLDLGFDVGLRNIRSMGDLLCAAECPAEELRQLLVPHTTKSGKQRGRAVFLVSTWHEGGPTEDSVDFIDILSSVQVKDCLKGLRFSVFGFGDSAYAQTYNLQGKLMDKLLEDLGGKRLLPLALGDARKDTEWEFEEWKWKGFWPTFAELSMKDCETAQSKLSGKDSRGESTGEGTGEGAKPNRVQVPEPKLVESGIGLGDFVLEYTSKSSSISREEIVGRVHPSSSHFYRGVDCRVKSIDPLWLDDELDSPVDQLGSVVQIEFDLSEDDAGLPPFLYSTGDNIGVMPVNRAEMVEQVADHLGFDLEDTFVLRPPAGGDASTFSPKVPTPCTVAEYLSLYAELTLPPRRDVMRVLATFAEDTSEREELYQMSKKKNYDKFRESISKEHLGLADIITNYYPSIQISLADFIQICTPLQPRWYSASSSSLASPHALSLTFDVITIPRALDGSFCLGACSHHMANLLVGESCRIMKLGTSGFVLPLSPKTPLLMVANGTGVAPMRALCQERFYQKKMGLPVGTTKLFFGIRSRNLDYLYRDEFQEIKETGSWFDVTVACSRESEEKVYVQHALEEESEKVWDVLERGGHIYVCGAEAMISDVDKVLRSLVERKIGKTGRTADEYLKGLEKSKHYIREGWTSRTET
eukprot:CAMPEP_0194027998 /NCGR_PEP_ID=MMETSP0009_2-20130614/2025_1 /TAXON_ID=210454 /ORGANISM="Grammatophora oceanica, Strain CCMP 410" /LENGTH=1067 /DNA_ID=CAMNT_0038667227 /DNA_START=62 /DNA_END=3265 /DNA_ORIENTATION=+